MRIKTMKTTGIQNCFKTSVSSMIVIACFCFVSWQSIKCFVKYLENPQGTKLIMDSTMNQPIPAITVCANPKKSKYSKDVLYNKDVLKQCRIPT